MTDDRFQQTLAGLLRKRAELVGLVTQARDSWEASTVALNSIDAAIRVFSPHLGPEDLPESPPPAAFTGGTTQLQRFLLDMMRRTGKPLRTLEASAAVMADRGLNARDKVVATLIRKRCGDALGRLRLAGHIVSKKYGSGSELEWRVTDRGDDGAPIGGWRNGTTGAGVD